MRDLESLKSDIESVLYFIREFETDSFKALCEDGEGEEMTTHVVAVAERIDGMLEHIRLDSPIFDLNSYAAEVHKANAKWWHDPATGKPIVRNKGEQMMLIVSEVAEAMEGVRKGLMDDKLPNRSMEEVEMADAVIRIFDYCAGHGLDLHGAYVEKMQYNAQRADHKPENRLKDGGKKF